MGDVVIAPLPRIPWSAELAAQFATPELSELTALAAGQAASIPNMIHYEATVRLESGATGRYGPFPETLIGSLQTVAARSIGLPVRCDVTEIVGLPRSNENALMAAASGILDCALWDAFGNRTGMAVARLLGARNGAAVPTYASLISVDVDGPLTDRIAREALRCGFWGQKWRLPDGRSTGEIGLERNVARVERLLSAAPGARIMLEIGGIWDPDLLLEFCQRAEHLPIEWIEEPFDSRHWPYPEFCKKGLAAGEHCRSHADLAGLLSSQATRTIQPDAVACGGLSILTGLRTLIVSAGRRFSPHGRAFVPALHLAAGMGDLAVMEYNPLLEAERQFLMQMSVQPSDGFVEFVEQDWRGLWPRRP